MLSIPNIVKSNMASTSDAVAVPRLGQSRQFSAALRETNFNDFNMCRLLRAAESRYQFYS